MSVTVMRYSSGCLAGLVAAGLWDGDPTGGEQLGYSPADVDAAPTGGHLGADGHAPWLDAVLLEPRCCHARVDGEVEVRCGLLGDQRRDRVRIHQFVDDPPRVVAEDLVVPPACFVGQYVGRRYDLPVASL